MTAKHCLVGVFLFLTTLIFHGQPDPAVSFGERVLLYSEILEEEREVWVYLPEMFNDSLYDPVDFPVVYVLDGPSHFNSVVNCINSLSACNNLSILPRCIVVGIANTDRTRDFTPSHVAEVFGDKEFGRNSGGGDRFLDFVEFELIPHIDENYPTQKCKTLVGHSLGGLMTIHCMLHRPHVFKKHLAIDPSLWWNNSEILLTSDSLIKTNSSADVYLAIANTAGVLPSLEEAQNNTFVDAEHINAQVIFDHQAQKQINQYSSKYYEDDEHMSVPFISIYDGLRFLFQSNHFKASEDLFSDGNRESPETWLERVEEYYKKLSYDFGHEIEPDERYMHFLAVVCLSIDKKEHAKAFFEYNLQNHPRSFSAHDAMGDYWIHIGEIEKAELQFQQALEIQFHSNTLMKLNAIAD